jgi:hypothetical protein
MRLDVLTGGKVVGTGTSVNGRPAVVTLDEAQCPGDDAADFEAQVRWQGDARTGANYQLERTGTF